VAFDWGNGLNNGGCVGAFCGNNRNNGGCTGSSCNGNNDNDDLQAECTVDDTSIEEGDCVTYRVTTKGGDSPFDYEWSGDTRGEDDGDSSFKVCYPKAGTYEVEVEVTDDDNQKDADSCKVKVENKDDDDDNDFDVECRVSDSTIDEGDCVTYSVRIDGGDSPFEYDWNGDLEGEDDDNEKTIRVCYDDAGDYDVTIVVEDDDGNRESDTCEVEVDNDTRGTNSSSSRSYSNRNDSPNGTLASIDSVYLSQIPYTGPEETAALVAAGLAVIGLGFGAAISLKKRAMRKQTADRVAAFKAANLAKKVRA
jgi:LPXTG-motif cell wall-anchored protein